MLPWILVSVWTACYKNVEQELKKKKQKGIRAVVYGCLYLCNQERNMLMLYMLKLLYLTCQKLKYDRHKAPGLLMPLPIPQAPWESITMDFIFELPTSKNGNDGIWRHRSLNIMGCQSPLLVIVTLE